MIMQLLKPIRWRLTDPQDIERYGDRWYTYDESAIARLPLATMVELEQEMDGRSILGTMREFRFETAASTAAVMWLSLRLAADRSVPMPDSFAEFTPLVMFADWEGVPAPVTPPLDPTTSSPSDSPTEQSTESPG